MKQASGIRQVYFGEMGVVTGTDPEDTVTPAANWLGPNRIIGGADPEITPNGQDDGIGLPLYASSTFVHTFEVPDLTHYNALKAFENADTVVVVAMKKADNTFEYMKNVNIAVRIIPHLDKSNFQNMRVYLYAAHVDQDDIISDVYTA